MSEKIAVKPATDTVKPATDTVKPKGKQLSAVFSPEELAAIEDYRWSNRVERTSDIVREAVMVMVTPKG